jgi:predicted metalloprotease with PDZ domain
MIVSDAARGAVRYLLRVAVIVAAALAPAYAATNYTISLASPEQHLVEVQILLPKDPEQRELQLPVWNALYQVRDFAQYVNWVRAKDRAGRPLTVRELDKSRWQISGAEGRRRP